MRRLWAHIAIAFACIFAAVAVFPTVLKNVSTNGDYKTSRQFTYELVEKVSEDEEVHPAELSDDSAKNMARIMEQRLINSGISTYNVSYSGNDKVIVDFYAESDTKYQQVSTYLSFSGSFALMNQNNDVVPGEDFLNGRAYLQNVEVNQYPVVILPVRTDNDKYKALIQWARENPVAGEADEDGNPGESTAPIYFIYNYTQGDTYQSLEEQGKINSKIYLTFDAISDEKLYHDANNNSFEQICGFSDENGNGYADPEEVRAAFDRADFFLNLFNAEALDFDVNLIKGYAEGTIVYIAPAIENILDYNSKMAWNNTLTAIVAAVLIIALLLVVFYRLGALSVMTTAIMSVFLSFLAIVASGLQYNTLALVGFAIIALISLVSGIIYCAKLKEEAYKGRTLKKANQEASRKSTLPIVDIHFVTIAIGVMLYFLAGQAVHTFASILILGGLISVLVSLFGMKGMMWLATNTTALSKKYEVFAIESAKVPDHMADEKQKYYGPYADVDFTKKKKGFSIAAGALFGLSLIGLIVIGAVNGNIFKPSNSAVTGSEIYVVNTVKRISSDDSETASLTRNDLNALLGDMKLYYDKSEFGTIKWDDTDKHETLYSLVKDVTEFTIDDSKTENDETTKFRHTYYQLSLKKTINPETTYVAIKGDTVLTEDNSTLAYAFSIYFEDINTEFASTSFSNTIELNIITKMGEVASPEWNKIALATFLGTLIATVYLLIRYRLSRGLAMLVYPTASAAIALCLFALLSTLGMTLPASVSILIPLAAIASYIFMIGFANKERDLIADDKVKDNSYEHRVELSKRALGIGFSTVGVAAVIGVYLFINFFGFGPNATSFIYLAGVIALLLSLALVLFTYMPLSNLLYKLFSKVHIEAKPRKKKKNAVVKKSAEPEEAIFIGIND